MPFSSLTCRRRSMRPLIRVGLTPAVGSSSKSIVGFFINAIANSKSFCCPNDKSPANKKRFLYKPTKDNKILLVCSNKDEVFYFSLLMEKEPKRVFLVKNLKLKNDEKTLPNQELSVLEDTKTMKIMSTLPDKDYDWPLHYFTIYNDQNFYYENIRLGNVSPQIIKDKAMKKTPSKNNCSKATNEGLL